MRPLRRVQGLAAVCQGRHREMFGGDKGEAWGCMRELGDACETRALQHSAKRDMAQGPLALVCEQAK